MGLTYGGSQGFWTMLVVGGSLVFASSSVIAEEFSATVEEVRDEMVGLCGDPDEIEASERWGALWCWEDFVERLMEADTLPIEDIQVLISEVQIRRAFLEGLDEGSLSCDGGDSDFGDEDSDSDDEDWGDDEGSDDSFNTEEDFDESEPVTICHPPEGARKKRRGVGFTISVPRWIAAELFPYGATKGPCVNAPGAKPSESRGEVDIKNGKGGGVKNKSSQGSKRGVKGKGETSRKHKSLAPKGGKAKGLQPKKGVGSKRNPKSKARRK
jgi:hypothetical protein